MTADRAETTLNVSDGCPVLGHRRCRVRARRPPVRVALLRLAQRSVFTDFMAVRAPSNIDRPPRMIPVDPKALMPGLSHVAIMVATKWELYAVRASLAQLASRSFRDTTSTGLQRVVGHLGACRISLVQTGIGPRSAARAGHDLLADGPCDLIISAGFACALTVSRIADLLVGTEAVQMSNESHGAVPCDARFTRLALAVAEKLALPVHVGRFVTVDRILGTADEKQAAAQTPGAVGLDMESAALGAVAVERQVPFLITRTVSDLVHEPLPADFNLFLSRTGWLPGVLSVMRPAAVRGLWRLKKQATEAQTALTAFFVQFLRAV